MNGPIVRALIVEDSSEWRFELRRIVEGDPTLCVVGEAKNGAEGVRLASDLTPDIILLDLGLPILNGIEVATTVFGSGKHPKIIFVSENRSLEIAQQAFNIGALAYVVKSEVRRELLAAIHSVLQGKQFASKSLQLDGSVVHPSSEHPLHHKGDTASSVHAVGFRHEVAFYENDSHLEAGFSECAKAAIHAQKAVLLVATETHRTNIYRRLSAEGIDLNILIATGTYNELDATSALSRIMINNSPDPLRCREILEGVVRNIPTLGGAGNRELAICAECAPTLLMQGEVKAAMELERHWDALSRAHPIDTLCGYFWDAFPDRDDSPMFQQICAEHTAIQQVA